MESRLIIFSAMNCDQLAHNASIPEEYALAMSPASTLFSATRPNPFEGKHSTREPVLRQQPVDHHSGCMCHHKHLPLPHRLHQRNPYHHTIPWLAPVKNLPILRSRDPSQTTTAVSPACLIDFQNRKPSVPSFLTSSSRLDILTAFVATLNIYCPFIKEHYLIPQSLSPLLPLLCPCLAILIIAARIANLHATSLAALFAKRVTPSVTQWIHSKMKPSWLCSSLVCMSVSTLRLPPPAESRPQTSPRQRHHYQV